MSACWHKTLCLSSLASCKTHLQYPLLHNRFSYPNTSNHSTHSHPKMAQLLTQWYTVPVVPRGGNRKPCCSSYLGNPSYRTQWIVRRPLWSLLYNFLPTLVKQVQAISGSQIPLQSDHKLRKVTNVTMMFVNKWSTRIL